MPERMARKDVQTVETLLQGQEKETVSGTEEMMVPENLAKPQFVPELLGRFTETQRERKGLGPSHSNKYLVPWHHLTGP